MSEQEIRRCMELRDRVFLLIEERARLNTEISLLQKEYSELQMSGVEEEYRQLTK